MNVLTDVDKNIINLQFQPEVLESLKRINEIVEKSFTEEQLAIMQKTFESIQKSFPFDYYDSLIESLNKSAEMIQQSYLVLQKQNSEQIPKLSELTSSFINDFSIDMSFESFEDISQELVLKIKEEVDDNTNVYTDETYCYEEQMLQFNEKLDYIINKLDDNSLPSSVRTVFNERLINMALDILQSVIFYAFFKAIDFQPAKQIIEVIIRWINNIKSM